MSMMEFLREITAVPGTSGYESPVAQAFYEAFAPFADEISIDPMGSVVAVQRGTGAGPRLLLTAHIDEVGLMTTDVEEDGSVRFMPMGVAAMMLPAQEVTLLTREGPLYGVVGAGKTEEEDKAVCAQALFIDTGLPAAEVRRLVPPGTPVQLSGPLTALENGRVAGKTLDDRACCAILLQCARKLHRMTHDAEVVYLLAVREEFDGLGAAAGAERIRPDLAVALDVTHGTMEGCEAGETFPMDASTLAVGPNLHRGLTALLKAQAQRLHVKTVPEVCAGHTGTDAWAIQIACEGIPCALLSLPVKYMHTTVELASQEVMAQQAHLLAQTAAALDARWEELVCS